MVCRTYSSRVVGIVHVIEHDSCWTLRPYAYLQDLFTHEDYRGLGGATALIEHVKIYTEKRACDRVYWAHSSRQFSLTATL